MTYFGGYEGIGGGLLDRRGFALATVLLIVIVVPIAVFGITFFITNTAHQYDSQARFSKALYLAQAGIQKAVFGIASTGAVPAVPDWNANNKIALTLVASGCNIYQLKATGTSVAPSNPTDQISRTVFAQYDATARKISMYLEGDGTGVPPPSGIAMVYDWEFPEGSGAITGAAPYTATIVGAQPARVAWVAGPDGAGDWAIRFNITSTHTYARVPDHPTLDLSSGGVIEVRVRFNSAPPNSCGIVHKGNLSNNSDEAYGISLSGRRFRLELRNTSGNPVSLQGTTVPVQNVWYLVRGEWSPAGMRIYVNGVLENSNATAVTVRNTAGTLQFGTKYTNNSGQRSQVTIDDVKIYGTC